MSGSASSSSGNTGFGSGSQNNSSGGSGTKTPGTNGSSGSTSTTMTMDFNGQTRSYILVKPNNFDANRVYPLVLSFHGNPGDMAGQQAQLPFETVSGDAAIVVYPQALLPDGWDQYTPTDSNADMSWIHALPAEIGKSAKIDPKKIYGYGWSGGSFFIVNFACRFGDMFRAISSNAGGGPDESQSGFQTRPNSCYVCPGGPVATLVMHGDSDDVVGGDSGEFTAICYADENGCDENEDDTDPQPCKAFRSCPAATPVKYCLIPGMGHQPWDQSMQQSWSFFTSLP